MLKNCLKLLKKKVKLYVSDVYSFHNKKINKILLSNKIVRKKIMQKEIMSFSIDLCTMIFLYCLIILKISK